MTPGPARTVRLAWRIVLEARDDDLPGEAARVAFYFFLSIWPAILGLFAITGIVGGATAFDRIMAWIAAWLPDEPTRYLERFVREITSRPRPGMLSVGIVLAFWSGSNAFASLADGLNKMYDIEETRPWWKRKALAMVVLFFGTVFLTSGATAILVGAEIVEKFGVSPAWNALRWPLAFVFLVALLTLAYDWLPARDQRLSRGYVAIGALTGAALWVITTTGFRLYVTHLGNASQTYGFVGSVLVLLMWFYLSALAILFGGEVAASLEQGLHESDVSESRDG